MTVPHRFSVDPALHDDLVTGTLELKASGEPLTVELTVPVGPTTTEALLPVLHQLSNLFVARGEARVEREGKTISCRMGCAACCRQMVPVTGAEARYLARLVDAMPEPRRSHVRARFDAALAALDAAGMLERIVHIDQITLLDQPMGYFRLGVACPFLEDEACSIHADRPLTCREFLVTSPAANCSAPAPGNIDGVKLEWKFLKALLHAEPDQRWVPLVLALRHAETTPPPPERTGPEILGAVIASQQ